MFLPKMHHKMLNSFCSKNLSLFPTWLLNIHGGGPTLSVYSVNVIKSMVSVKQQHVLSVWIFLSPFLSPASLWKSFWL